MYGRKSSCWILRIDSQKVRMVVRMLYASALVSSYCRLVHCNGKDNGKFVYIWNIFEGLFGYGAWRQMEKKCDTN